VSFTNILLCALLSFEEILRQKDNSPFLLGFFVLYNLLVGVLLYFFNIHHVSVNSLLYSIYLGVGNFVFLSLVVFLRFIAYFNANTPYRALIDNIPVATTGLLSFSVSIFTVIVRKYVVQGLISPVSIQREKGIESAIVVVRREYPEIFQ